VLRVLFGGEGGVVAVRAAVAAVRAATRAATRAAALPPAAGTGGAGTYDASSFTPPIRAHMPRHSPTAGRLL
jgi:hypothetical protein